MPRSTCRLCALRLPPFGKRKNKNRTRAVGGGSRWEECFCQSPSLFVLLLAFYLLLSQTADHMAISGRGVIVPNNDTPWALCTASLL